MSFSLIFFFLVITDNGFCDHIFVCRLPLASCVENRRGQKWKGYGLRMLLT